jgi:glycosyltransferase involved in cell wall biosynthesis
VSIEAAKWGWALEEMGFAVRTVAGEGQAHVLLPGLRMESTELPHAAELAAALGDADVVVVENLCSLPLNGAASAMVGEALRGRRAVMHHHDLPWQREAFADSSAPLDDPQWAHVTINELSRRELAERGINATTIPNRFHAHGPAGDRDGARRRLGVKPGQRLLLHPVRAVPRKGVPAALALAEDLGAAYWLLGPTEEGYGPVLEPLLAATDVAVVRGMHELSLVDCYAACDAVVFPSSWEGFGNPVVESAVHRRPLAIRRYPVAAELEGFGFRWFSADDPGAVDSWLTRPDTGLLDHNQAVARRHFSLEELPDRLSTLFEQQGWTAW